MPRSMLAAVALFLAHARTYRTGLFIVVESAPYHPYFRACATRSRVANILLF
jgi:hypothetical protein